MCVALVRSPPRARFVFHEPVKAPDLQRCGRFGEMAKPRVGATDAASGEGEPPGGGAILSFVSTREESFRRGRKQFLEETSLLLLTSLSLLLVSAATALLLLSAMTRRAEASAGWRRKVNIVHACLRLRAYRARVMRSACAIRSDVEHELHSKQKSWVASCVSDGDGDA